MARPCPSCCKKCRDIPTNLLQTIPDSSPFALSNLIPVGVLNINVVTSSALEGDAGAIAAMLCGHSHADDGWHAFNGSALLSHLASMADDSFCRDLDFLIKHQFVAATCRFDDSNYNNDNQTLIIRIYLIPYDLPNVQGRLRTRKEPVLAPARRYLSALLSRIRCCFHDWNGQSCNACQPLLDSDKVRLVCCFY